MTLKQGIQAVKKDKFAPDRFSFAVKSKELSLQTIVCRKASPYTLAEVQQLSAKYGKKLKQITIQHGISTKYGLACFQQMQPEALLEFSKQHSLSEDISRLSHKELNTFLFERTIASAHLYVDAIGTNHVTKTATYSMIEVAENIVNEVAVLDRAIKSTFKMDGDPGNLHNNRNKRIYGPGPAFSDYKYFVGAPGTFDFQQVVNRNEMLKMIKQGKVEIRF